MTSARVSQAVAQAKSRRTRVLWLARLAFRSLEKEQTPAAMERVVSYCRAVVAADDALERLGAARG